MSIDLTPKGLVGPRRGLQPNPMGLQPSPTELRTLAFCLNKVTHYIIMDEQRARKR